MKLEHSFEVEAPIETVWEALIDVERVAPCLPGAEITESDEEGVYKGNFTVKLGPTTAAYRGRMQMEEVDEAAHRVTMKATGQDKRGQGSAKATIVSDLSHEGGTTTVATATDFSITGKLARFGRGGMIEDVSNKLLRDFSSCLAETITAEQGSGEPGGTDDAAAEADIAPAGQASGEPAAGASEPSPPAAAQPRPPAKPPESKPIKGFSLIASVLWGRIKRLFARLFGRGR